MPGRHSRASTAPQLFDTEPENSRAGARRLGMRRWWFYVVTTFLVSFAFACPLFLFMREARLRAPLEGRGVEPSPA